MQTDPGRRTRVLAGGFLVAAVLFAYQGSLQNGFVEFDDNEYVTGNAVVRSGIRGEGIWWAFTAFHSANWHPLTWLSHMLDCQVWGLNPAGHHLTSVILHAVNTILLLGLLHRMTGSFWRSWLVAALFALHPLHVESVAWVAERKDVLSGCFWVLTLSAYAAYVRNPTRARYWTVPALFALGLMAKPILVTLPFVLLLMDYWPLRRARGWATLVAEKVPLFVLSAASAVITVLAQQTLGAVVPIERASAWARLSNAAAAYLRYLGRAFWPLDLAVYYLLRPVPLRLVVASVLLLSAVSVWAVRERRRRPYLLVGWLWFLGTLVPVIGLVQVGSQAMADRYTYIPLIGLFVMVAWGVPDYLGGRLDRIRHVFVAGLLAALAWLTCVQVGYWRNSVVLFERALSIGGSNSLVHYNLGVALAKEGRNEEAIVHYREALRLWPNYLEARNNLGDALYARGRLAEAEPEYREALRLKPDFAPAHNSLGVVLALQKRADEAIPHLQEAVRLQAGNMEFQYNLSSALAEAGRFGEAAVAARTALSLVDTNREPELAAGIRNRLMSYEKGRPPGIIPH